MDQYKVITPNPAYRGRAGGILFERGQAILSEHTLNPELGRSVEETVTMFVEDLGYEVIQLKSVDVIEQKIEPITEVVPHLTPKAKAKPKAKKRTVSGKPKEVVEVEDEKA